MNTANALPIEKGRRVIEEYEFSGRHDLTEIVVPKGIRKIGFASFNDCCNATELTLPKGLKVIYDHAFEECSKLRKVVIPQSVKEIWNDAFRSCTSLEEIILPEDFETFDFSFLTECPSLKKVVMGHAYEQKDGFIIERKTNKLVFALPWVVEGGKITIPEPVREIGDWAFALCGDATHLVIPKTMEEISAPKLDWLHFLKKIEIEDGSPLKTDGATVYRNNRLLLSIAPENNARKLVIPKGINMIEPFAFLLYSDVLEEIEVLDDGDDVFEIGWAAFQLIHHNDEHSSRKALKRVVFKQKRRCVIGEFAFPHCTGLKRLENAVCVSIEKCGFLGCKSLTEAPIGEETQYIGPSAFALCEGLTEVTLPKWLRIIDWGAFSGCSKLAKVHMGENLNYIYNRAFEDCKSLKSIDLPACLRMIGEEAFANCGLESVCIGGGVREIGNKALAGCENLKEATIPSRFRKRRDKIFADCKSLKVEGPKQKDDEK